MRERRARQQRRMRKFSRDARRQNRARILMRRQRFENVQHMRPLRFDLRSWFVVKQPMMFHLCRQSPDTPRNGVQKRIFGLRLLSRKCENEATEKCSQTAHNLSMTP